MPWQGWAGELGGQPGAGTVAFPMLESLAGALGGVTASSVFTAGLLLQAAEGRSSRSLTTEA